MTAAAAPTVAIVLVNFNSADYIGDLITSLNRLTYPAWRLVCVDNRSEDESPLLIEDGVSGATVIRNSTNAGFAPAVNIGLGHALRDAPEFVMLLNPDTTCEPDLVERLVEASDGQALVVPKVLSAADGTLAGHSGRFDWLRGLQIDTHDGEAGSEAPQERRELETGSFSCMLIPTAAIRAAGPLDERLAFYYEDTDFVERCRRSGFKLLYEPAAVLYHAEGSSSGGRASAFSIYYTTRNRPFVVKKYVSRPAFAFFTAYFLSTRVLRCLDLLRTRQWRILAAVLRGMRDYYTGRMGMTYTPRQLVGKR